MHFRFRRYRAFLLGAAVFLFLLYRLSATTDDALVPLRPDDGDYSSGPVRPNGSASRPDAAAADAAVPDKGAAAPNADAVAAPEQVLSSPAPVSRPSALPEAAPAADPVTDQAEPDSLPQQDGPAEFDGSYGRPGSPHGHAPAPAAAAAEDGSEAPQAIPSPAVIHWVKKARDYFPVPEDAVMVLPTGATRPIPRIQHDFANASAQPGGAETDAERAIRLARLASVRSEMQHAWTGYRAYAWGHDELKPVSRGFSDPFCGWAATLVDGLDTLWIMGLRAEFDDAYEAVKRIDFTTSQRNEIPVFETIIRYLGGLLGAYDVSGGPAGGYPALLTKAVELADILMEVFDTPNRMPVLYYDWRPAFASQRKTANVRSGIAEMGTMSLEFTRLAQLTGNNRYYDAIARITDALEEYQNRGTALPGLFPRDIDASGCNRTTAALEELVNASLAAQAQAAAAANATAAGDDAPTGYQPGEPASDSMQTADLVRQAANQPRDSATGADTTDTDNSRVDTPHDVTKRDQMPADAERAGDEESPSVAAPVVASPVVPSPLEEGSKTGPLAADDTLAPFQCIPMNLTSGSTTESYSMGGSQDSAYEYFPKQYLLLGGLVTKYRTMHEKVIEGVKKYLLYRPVIPDQTHDILFSAVATSRDGTDANLDYTYEVPHLTCFLGGMFAMGGRIFDRPEDIAIARQLTDGCVWAYDSTPSGLMPEFSIVMGCRDPAPGACAWNETAWYRALDPSADWREGLMRQYEADMEEWRRTKAAVQAEIQRLQEQDSKHADGAAESPKPDTPGTADSAGARAAGQAETVEQPLPLGKRDFADVRTQTDKHVEEEPEHDADSGTVADSKDGERTPDGDAESQPPPATPVPEEVPEKKTEDQPQEPQEQPPPPPLPIDLVIPPEPTRPLWHHTFARQRIEQEGLPPGFVDIGDRRYILRPEAIESVWYMYRITGERQWQDKGWRMFEAVVRAAKTEVGHSAVSDVTAAAPVRGAAANQQDSMESFWLAETLKYFYLLFAEPDVISLDEWVLNTEAHPFRRPA